MMKPSILSCNIDYNICTYIFLEGRDPRLGIAYPSKMAVIFTTGNLMRSILASLQN